jgi:hypothetical protein
VDAASVALGGLTFYAASVANVISATIDGLSSSDLLTRVQIGHMWIWAHQIGLVTQPPRLNPKRLLINLVSFCEPRRSLQSCR